MQHCHECEIDCPFAKNNGEECKASEDACIIWNQRMAKAGACTFEDLKTIENKQKKEDK